MKKGIYTLAVNNYEPGITDLTFPLMKQYAKKIGADFHVIEDRKFPDLPPVYEKFQVYELSKEHGNDWNIFIDADTLIHPDFWDVTALVSKDTTVSGYTSDFTPMRFKPDEYFLRDGRFIGKGNWFGVFSDWCRDYYHPLDDISFEEAVKNINVIQDEKLHGIRSDHLIDDYLVSRNISRYGLKHTLISALQQNRGLNYQHLLHWYVPPTNWDVPCDHNPALGFTSTQLNEMMMRYGKPTKEFTATEVKIELIKLNMSIWGVL
jgi:hypothetical protein